MNPLLWRLLPPRALGLRRGPVVAAQPIPPWTTYIQTARDAFRAADVATDLYELYVGRDGPADLLGNPVAVSATLPMTWNPPLPATGATVLHVVVRRRNKFGLRSFNIMERLIAVTAAGAEDLGPITAPRDVKVYDDASGYVRVVASYLRNEDRNRANTWEVYVSTTAVDPVPGVDAPVALGAAATMAFGSGVAYLTAKIGAYAPGATIRLVVVAKRSSDGRRGAAVVVVHSLASSLNLTEADLLGGRSFT